MARVGFAGQPGGGLDRDVYPREMGVGEGGDQKTGFAITRNRAKQLPVGARRFDGPKTVARKAAEQRLYAVRSTTTKNLEEKELEGCPLLKGSRTVPDPVQDPDALSGANAQGLIQGSVRRPC